MTTQATKCNGFYTLDRIKDKANILEQSTSSGSAKKTYVNIT